LNNEGLLPTKAGEQATSNDNNRCDYVSD
jgi:hypothetical protein